MLTDFLDSVFGSNLISSLAPEFVAILCVCILFLVAWIMIKIFKAIGLFF